MPKLNLKDANYIKSSFGMIKNLKGQGFSWACDYSFDNLYGTNVGQIPIHLRSQNVVLDVNGNVASITNIGGAGATFDAAPVYNPITISNGGLVISSSAIRFNNPADMVGTRVFFVAYRTASGQVWFGGALANANGANSPAVSIRLSHGLTGESIIGGLSTTAPGPIPRSIGVWAIIEWEIQPDTTRLLCDGIEVTPGSGMASPRLITDFGRHPNGTSTPHWGGRIGDIVFLNTDGSAEMEYISANIRISLAKKYGIIL